MMHSRGAAGVSPTLLSTGDRIRVASGVFGNPGQIRSISAGHILVDYDHGGREVIDPTRRAVWTISPSAG